MASSKNLEIKIKPKVIGKNEFTSLASALDKINKSLTGIHKASIVTSKSTKTLATAKKKLSKVNMTLVKGSQAHIQQLKRLQKGLSTTSKRYHTLQAGIKKYTAAQRQAKGSTGIFNAGLMNMGKNLSAIGIGIGMAITKLMQLGRVVLRIAKTVVNAFAKQELSVMKLRSVLKLTGSEGSLKVLTKQAADLQKVTIFGDEDIINAQAMLGTFKLNVEQIKLLTPALVSMGTSLQQMGRGEQDLQTLAIQIGKVAGTELISSLTRMGVVMTKTQTKQLKLATGMEKTKLLVEILNQNYGTLATDVGQSVFARLEQIKHAFGDNLEVVGQLLTTGLAPLGIGLKVVLELFSELGKMLADTYVKFADAIRGTWQTDEQMKSLASTIRDALVKGLAFMLEHLERLIPLIEVTSFEVKTLVKEMGEAGLLGVAKILAKVLGKILYYALQGVIQLLKYFVKGIKAIVWIGTKVVKTIGMIVDAAKRLGRVLGQAAPKTFLGGVFNMLGEVGNRIQWVIDKINELKGGTATRGKYLPQKSRRQAAFDVYGLMEKDETTTGTTKSGTGKTKQDLKEINKEEEELQRILNANNIIWGKTADFTKQTLDALKEMNQLAPKELGQGLMNYEEWRLTRLEQSSLADWESKKGKDIGFEKMVDGLQEAFSSVNSVLTNMMDALNIKAHTFIGQMVSGFNTVLSIIQTIMSVMNAVDTITSFIGMIIPGAAGGAGMPSGTQGGAGAPAGTPTGNSITNIMNTINNNTRIVEVPYVASTRVEGRDLKLVLTRENKNDSFKSGDL